MSSASLAELFISIGLMLGVVALGVGAVMVILSILLDTRK